MHLFDPNVNQVGDGTPDNLADAQVPRASGGLTFVVPRRNNGPILSLSGGQGISFQYTGSGPTFEVEAFQAMARLATKAGVEGAELTIHTPLIDLTKAGIIRRGAELGVDYSLTVSCYQADGEGRACGVCDSCRIRAAGFQAADVSDPTRYQST